MLGNSMPLIVGERIFRTSIRLSDVYPDSKVLFKECGFKQIANGYGAMLGRLILTFQNITGQQI